MIFIFVPRSDMSPGYSGYGRMRTSEYTFGGVVINYYDTKGVAFFQCWYERRLRAENAMVLKCLIRGPNERVSRK